MGGVSWYVHLFRTSWHWPLTRFESDLGNFVEGFFGPEGWLPSQGVFSPQVNVVETDSDFETTVDLPGMKADDFHVEIEGNELRISGHKQEETEEKGKTYHRVERHYGNFRRVIPLPAAVDAEHITAEYKDGVVTVKVPKTEQAKPRKIEIKS